MYPLWDTFVNSTAYKLKFVSSFSFCLNCHGFLFVYAKVRFNIMRYAVTDHKEIDPLFIN